MSGNRLLIDTNIVIYFLSGDHTLTNLLDGKHTYVSVITKLELLSYPELSKSEEQKIEYFLNACTIVELSPAIQQETIQLRKKHRLKLPDSVIAASAIVFDIPLLTSDTALQKIAELDILHYQKI
ncbi:MAG: type II toxin-antitoxin system VapC family toxin [Bacteroidetes bacterium]|nr:type II toxin-antitoxin system VapC family toxin [Bacteroidota bacterium]